MLAKMFDLTPTPLIDHDEENVFAQFKRYNNKPSTPYYMKNMKEESPFTTNGNQFGLLPEYDHLKDATSPLLPNQTANNNNNKKMYTTPIIPPPILKSFSECVPAGQPKQNKTKKTKPKKKKNKDILIDPERCWDQVKGSHEVIITMKSRRELPSVQVDNHLYSSLKYEFFIKAKELPYSADCYILRMNMIYDTKEEVPQSISRKTLLKGTTETTLTKTEKGYKGYLKIQFSNDLSYHKLKREVRYQLQLFASDALHEGQALAVLQSPKFRVYCRKPDTEHTQKRKRQQHDVFGEELDDTRPVKKKYHQNWQDLKSCMQELCASIQTLKGDEKQLALNQLLREMKRCERTPVYYE